MAKSTTQPKEEKSGKAPAIPKKNGKALASAKTSPTSKENKPAAKSAKRDAKSKAEEAGVFEEPTQQQEEKNITYIDQALIEVGDDRLRSELNEARMIEIQISIKDIGLINPITVTPKGEGFVLVAGLHRLTAYQHLYKTSGDAFKEIPAIVVDQAKAKVIEISENLFRSDLCVLEKAIHLTKYLEAVPNKTGITKALNKLAKDIGKSQRTLFDYRKIGADIQHPEKIMALKHDLKNSTKQLEALAKKTPEEQDQIVQKLAENPKLNVRKAYGLVKASSSPQDGDLEKPQGNGTAPIRISVSLKDALNELATKKKLETRDFTEKLLQKALEAYSKGKLVF